jgi:trk system potassium uptake protein TrkH
MQLFQVELSESEKALPRIAQMASSIGIIYVALTVLCAISYDYAGMTTFEAITHALATISTGGFSTSDGSIGKFDSAAIETICIFFMILGCLPFVLFVKTLRGNWQSMFYDSQVRAFLAILLTAILVMIAYLILHNHSELEHSIRTASFNVVSVMTGTGFTHGDYGSWGGFAVTLLFFLMVVGGCAGSTTCGIKVFRFQIIYSVTMAQIKQLIYPSGVFTPHYNHYPLPRGVSSSVMSFFFVYALSFTFLAIGLSFIGLDFITAMSGAVTAISNVGPGMGDIIGPSGTFQPLPDTAKWMMCVGMIMGRLELFTVLVLFLPAFWQK